jgi:FkbM family methyltransferase
VDVVRQVFVAGQFDLRGMAQFPEVVRAYHAILDSGRVPLLIDLGANIGASSVWFGQMFPRARLIAVEPAPDNARLCRRNMTGWDARVVQAAIGGTGGNVDLQGADRDAWAYSTVRSEHGLTTVRTISEIVQRHGAHGKLFVVKIDIEGFESDLFSTDVDWVDEATMIIIEPHDWLFPGAGTSRNFQRVLGDKGFDVVILGEHLVYVRMPEAQGTAA